MDKIKIAAVVGPTASGKSALAVEIAKQLNGEVISCDSMQVYDEMDIGTAKIMPDEMEGIPHHLLNMQSYKEPWNVELFQKNCRKAIEDIASRGKLPVLCGGTGLYLKAALYDYEFDPEEEDPAYKAELEKKSTGQLYELLKDIDPQSLEKIHANNRKRIIRALMIAHCGPAKSIREQQQKHEPLYDIFYVGLECERDWLWERMKKRVDLMFEQGLVKEVTDLFSNPETWNCTSFQGIGYKEFKDWFEQKKSLEEVKESIYIHTRQYAKRQMTWFRNQMPVIWFRPQNREEILQEITRWYSCPIQTREQN